MGALDNFSFDPGSAKMNDIEARLDQIALYLSQSFYGDPRQYLTLPLVGSLSASAPTGSLAVSGSGAAQKIYMWNGTTWQSGSFGGVTAGV